MRLKTYVASSMDEALGLIRKELGNEAVIVSSLTEGKKIRVTAAVEKMPENETIQGTQTSPRQTQELLVRIAEYHQMPQKIRDQFIETLSSMSSQKLEKGIEACLENILQLSSLNLDTTQKCAPIIMLTGSMGAGKSVTLGKIAAEIAINNQKAKILTTDLSKAGALSQMQTYSSALKMDIQAITKPDELEALVSARDKDCFLLIDTPGINPFQERDQDLISQYIMAVKHPPILVLSAGGDPTETLEQIEAYKTLGVTKLIMTKIDLVKRLGSLIAALIGGNLELCALGSGPHLGSLLKPASSDYLSQILTRYLPENVFQEAIPQHQTMNTQALPQWLQGVREIRR